MESIIIAVVVAIITGTISPMILLWMKNKNEIQERLRVEAREDAREARADSQRALVIAGLETVKTQTDGMIAQVSALAKAAGVAEEKVKAQNTADTLALGQAQGRDAERESIASKATTNSDTPLPVKDDRTALASERVAEATERSADAAQRVASVAEDKKGK